jgi:uncharacterized membrane protein
MSKPTTAKKRLLIAAGAGALAAAILFLLGAAKFAPLVGWDVAALAYASWVWMVVWKMNPSETKQHANSENPGRALADTILICASIISLAAVGFMIAESSSSSGLEKAFEVALSLVSVFAAWLAVHTNYTLKYGELYYSQPEGGVNFNENPPPRYSDFAYLAFTIALTFQVSDTDLETKLIRQTVLKHALLSYLFGAVIIATVINTVSGLGQ